MKSPSSPPNSETARRVLDIPGGPRRRLADEGPAPAVKPADQLSRPTSERRLIVGREISLAGEINACDHLVVEGRIEAKLKECRIIEVADSGVFKGSAEIEEADIAGQFDGDISVRGKLRVRGTGTISGNIRYGRIEVEAGGRLVGTVEPLGAEPVQTGAASAGSDTQTPSWPLPSTSSPPTAGVVHALPDGGDLARSDSID